jgi:hypothetical protein
MNPQEINLPAYPFLNTEPYFEFNPKFQTLNADIFFRKYVYHNHADLLLDYIYSEQEWVMNDSFDYRL